MIKNFGQRIRNLRELKGFSLIELSNIIGVKKETLINWENNKTNPRIKHLIKMHEIFNVSVNYLLDVDNTNNN